MGKRAPILPEGYNPVGEALRKAVTPNRSEYAEQSEYRTDNNVVVFHHDEEKVEKAAEQGMTRPALAILKEREPIPDVPNDKELKQTSLRFRCTERERKKWHTMAQELTDNHGQLSHFARAAFVLIENAFEELQHLAPDIQRLKYPASTDQLGLALYEQRLAEFLFDAIKASGRPRG